MTSGIIDFHVHYVGARWKSREWAESGIPRYTRIAERIVDLDDTLRPVTEGHFAARVINAPVAMIAGAAAIAAEEIAAVNDHLVSVVRAHPQSLIGLATIDLWGDGAVREVERIADLGLTGVVVDAANMRTGAFAHDPETLPVWRKLRDLDLAVFFHPVSLPGVIEKFSNARAGVLLARGAVDAASLLALVDSPQWDELQGLKLVVPGIAASAFWFAPYFDGLAERLIGEKGRGIHVDTMGFDPANTRYLAGLIGTDRLVFGSDAPIVDENPDATKLLGQLRAAGIEGAALDAVTGGNARRLLKVS